MVFILFYFILLTFIYWFFFFVCCFNFAMWSTFCCMFIWNFLHKWSWVDQSCSCLLPGRFWYPFIPSDNFYDMIPSFLSIEHVRNETFFLQFCGKRIVVRINESCLHAVNVTSSGNKTHQETDSLTPGSFIGKFLGYQVVGLFSSIKAICKNPPRPRIKTTNHS